MAGRRPALQGDPELQRFMLPDVRPTGRRLGVGSYGSVEEVELNGLVCAGKRLHDALLEQGNIGVADITSKYLQECKVMAEMRHPHVVQFLGLCYLEGSTLPVIVMERLDRSLDDLLEDAPGLPLALKRSLLVDIARGLMYLHTRRPPVVHRDLTSRNILLTSSLVAKISDLGNARIVNLRPGQLARTLTRIPGTVTYMPPEAFSEGSQYGPKLDIFSFGHLMLFTLTQVFPDPLLPHTYPDPDNPGRLLGRSEVERRKDYIQTLHGHLGEQHPLVELLRQCLHNDPAKRPSAKELLQQLEAVRAPIEGTYSSHHIKVEMARLQVAMLSVLRSKETNTGEKDVEMEHLQLDLQQVQEDKRRLETEVEIKDGQLQQKDAQVQRLTDEITRQQRELQKSQSLVPQYRIRIDQLSQELTAAQKQRSYQQELMTDYQALRDRLHEAEAERDKYKDQYETTLRELAQRVERIKHLEQQRKEATERNEHMSFQLKQSTKNFDRERAAREEAVQVKNIVEEQIMKKDREISSLRQQLNVHAQHQLQRDWDDVVVGGDGGRTSPFTSPLGGGGGGPPSTQDEQQHMWVVRREEIHLMPHELGRGGWAVVQVAKFRSLPVAAKCLHLSQYNRHLFIREMNTVSRVRHPNLVQFIGATIEGEPIILTEMMHCSLRATLERGPLNATQITSISIDVARALNYLHLMHPDPVIHRNVSSTNVLLNPLPSNGWRAKVSDYGSVNYIQHLKTAGPGNPTYAAPEADVPKLQSPKMDVFSYGVLLLEMWSQRLPDVKERAAYLHRVQQPASKTLIQYCLEHQPDLRPNMYHVLEYFERH